MHDVKPNVCNLCEVTYDFTKSSFVNDLACYFFIIHLNSEKNNSGMPYNIFSDRLPFGIYALILWSLDVLSSSPATYLDILVLKRY